MPATLQYDLSRHPLIPRWQSNCKYKLLQDLDSFPGIPKDIKYVGVDFETTGLERQHSKVCGMSFSFKEGEAYYIPIRHVRTENRTEEELVEFIKKHFPDKTIVYWNARFDRAFMKRLGFKETRYLDAAINSYNVNITRCQKLNSSLKTHAKKILELEVIELWQAVGLKKKPNKNEKDIRVWEQPANKIMTSYACADADLTLRLFNVFKGEGSLDKRLKKIRSIDHMLLDGIEYMEDCGVNVDLKMLQEFKEGIEKDCEKMEKEIKDFVGYDINLGSHKQLTDLLFNKLKIPVNKKHLTPKGNPSANDEALKSIFNKYAGKYPELSKLKDWRKLQKKSNTYITRLLDGVSPRDGRIHSHYNTTRMITGRMSSGGDGVYLPRLNMQGIPKSQDKDEKYRIRNAFIPSPGYTWVKIDMSNIEIRLIANFSDDLSLIDLLNSGGDRHGETAKFLFGSDPSDADWKQKRDMGKTVNFNLAFTFGVNELCRRLKIPDKEGWAIYNKFFKEMYPTWGDYKYRLRREARITKKSQTMWGRVRSLEFEYSLSQGYGDRSALNHPIQGTNADLMRYAIYNCYKWIRDNNLFTEIKMLSTIHDELNFEVLGCPGEETFDQYVKTIKGIMDFTPTGFKVPVESNVSCGSSWEEQTIWMPV